MKCIKCLTDKVQTNEDDKPVINDADVIYHGFTLCIFHFRDWHSKVLKERDEKMSPIIKP